MTNDSDIGETHSKKVNTSYREETLDFEEDSDLSQDNNHQDNQGSDHETNNNNTNDSDNDSDPNENGEDVDEEDDDGDDDSSTEEEDDEECSRHSDSEPTCYICLNALEGQDIGAPESCENIHEFCFECIEEWSKRVNTCPIDRREFSFILVRKQSGGDVISKIPVIQEPTIEDELPFPDVTYCEVCNQCDREDRLLLCDGCDLGYHCECLSPPLDTIPIDEWFCPVCVSAIPQEQPNIFDLDIVCDEDNNDNNGENIDLNRRQTRQQSNHTQSVRRIARTGIFELVRNRIASRRTTDSRPRKTRSRSTSKTRKRKSKTPTKKKRKSTKKRSNSKRRTTKSRKSARRLPPSRKQIAQKLNICKLPKSHHGLPTMATASQISNSREVSGFSLGRSVSLFGAEKDFFEMRSYDDSFQVQNFDDSCSGIVTSAPSTINLGKVKKAVIPTSTRTVSVVDQLLSSSNLLFERAENIYLGRDGKIHLNHDDRNLKKTVNGTENGSITNTPTKTTDEQNNSNKNSHVHESQTTYKSNSDNNHEATSKNGNTFGQSDSNGTSNFRSIETEDDDIDGVEMKEEDVKEIEKKKKQPSVKDLFGGDDSDEEIEDDLKKRIFERGSIDPHFPLKLPIIFKTNFHETQKKIDEKQEVSIAKKWITIAPEPIEKTRNSAGPKWKSIEEPSNSGSIKMDSRIIEKETSSIPIVPKERNRVTFLSPEKEIREIEKIEKKNDKKVRLCKHGKVLKDKRLKKECEPSRKKENTEENTFSVESTVKEEQLPLIDSIDLALESPFNIDHHELKIDEKTENIERVKDEEEIKMISVRLRSPDEKRRKDHDDKDDERERNKKRDNGDRERRRKYDDDDDEEKRRRRDDGEKDRRRNDLERDRERKRDRRKSRERSVERSRDKRGSSRSRDRRDRSRREGSKHRNSKNDKTKSGRKRSRSRTPDESRHRSLRHKTSRRHRSRDRSLERISDRDRSLERGRDRERRRENHQIEKIDMKFDNKPKTPEEIEPPAKLDNVSIINRLNNFLPKNLDKKIAEPRNEKGSYHNVSKQIPMSLSSTKIDISRTPVRDESPTSPGPSKRNLKDDIFFDADYPQEFKDGLKVDEDVDEEDDDDDAPYSPGYSSSNFEPTSSIIKPDTMKPFTESQMSDILALAQKTFRIANLRESPMKSKRTDANTDLVDMDVESDSDDNGNHFGDEGGSIFSDGSYEPSESNRLVDAWEKIQAKAPEQFKDAFKNKKDSKGNKDKYIEKLHRQERVATEVKTYLKPFFHKRKISKDDYKEILKKAVTKICQNKKGIIQSAKIEKLVQDYVKRFRYLNKKDANGVSK